MEPLMTLQEVSEYLKIGVSALYKMAQQGRIPAVKVGSLWRFRRADIESWMSKEQN